jgi:hypothetical protein
MVQGEVVRIAGRIREEIRWNRGDNWDEVYREMAHAFEVLLSAWLMGHLRGDHPPCLRNPNGTTIAAPLGPVRSNFARRATSAMQSATPAERPAWEAMVADSTSPLGATRIGGLSAGRDEQRRPLRRSSQGRTGRPRAYSCARAHHERRALPGVRGRYTFSVACLGRLGARYGSSSPASRVDRVRCVGVLVVRLGLEQYLAGCRQ